MYLSSEHVYIIRAIYTTLQIWIDIGIFALKEVSDGTRQTIRYLENLIEAVKYPRS